MTITTVSWLFFALTMTPVFGSPPALHPLLQAEDHKQIDAPILLQWARSSDPQQRARVALAYGRMQQSGALVPLLVLLQDRAPKVRAAAAFGLGLLGWQAGWTGKARPHIVRALAQRLRDSDREVQRRALEAIGKYAPAHIEALLHPILQDAHQAVQVEALRALFRAKVLQRAHHPKHNVTPLTQQTLQLLAVLARSPSAKVRQHVAYYFARVKDPRGLDILLILAQDKATWTRFFALFSLRKLANPKALSVALASTQHPRYEVRVAAIQAVAAAKGAHQLPVKLTQDPTFHVRAAIAEAYGKSKPFLPQQQAQLQRWLANDPSITVQAAALEALAQQLGKTKPAQVLSWLQAASRHPSWVLREAAIGASAHIPTHQMNALAAFAKDKDPRVQAALVLTTGKRKGPKAFAVLKRALRADALAVRGYAVSAMTKRKEADAIPLLWETYKQSMASRWIELREEIINAIAKHKAHKQVLLYLKQAARDPAPSIAHKAIETLRKRGVKPLPAAPKVRLSHSPHRHLANAYFTQPTAPAPVIVIVTNRGTMEVTTTPQAAPLHVANLVGRVKAGLYNKGNWHRVISNFVIQGGDPDHSGWGDGGYQLRAEINRVRYRKGTLGMPRAMGWDTGSVQLFFTHTPTPHLDGRYTVFGHITKGLDVLDKIERGDLLLRAYIKADTQTPTTRAQPSSMKAPHKPSPPPH